MAIAYDAAGRELSEVHVTGSRRLHVHGPHAGLGGGARGAGELHGTGALGPVDGFGLEELVAGCAEAGIAEQDGGSRTASSSPDADLADSPAG